MSGPNRKRTLGQKHEFVSIAMLSMIVNVDFSRQRSIDENHGNAFRMTDDVDIQDARKSDENTLNQCSANLHEDYSLIYDSFYDEYPFVLCVLLLPCIVNSNGRL
jgi:hypothetical protein